MFEGGRKRGLEAPYIPFQSGLERIQGYQIGSKARIQHGIRWYSVLDLLITLDPGKEMKCWENLLLERTAYFSFKSLITDIAPATFDGVETVYDPYS
jgi:hypothetical protein